MKALLIKDLLILRRSRLLVGVLVIYPIAIALLIGLAISRSPGKPKVAIVDETPPGQTVQVGSERVPVSRYAEQIFDQVQPVKAPTRSAAVSKIKSGEVLAAVVIPPNIAPRLASGLKQGELEVLYNGNALEQSLVQAQIESALAQANIGFSEQIQRAASQAIGALLSGRNLGVLGAPDLIGLGQIPAKLHGVIARTPPGADRRALEQIDAFASFAAQNLTLAKNVLSTIGQPIQVKTTLIARPAHAAQHVRGGRGGEHLADVRVCAAGLGRRGAGARRAHAGAARTRAGLARRPARREGALGSGVLGGAGVRDARGDQRVRGARLGARGAVARSAGPAAGRRSRRWAWRSERSRARSARPRCWRSCCRCRWLSWRSCRVVRSARA